ncbi:MAG: hypothetical protein ACKOA8_16375, partial [Deltaproteobacteria bacterium]
MKLLTSFVFIVAGLKPAMAEFINPEEIQLALGETHACILMGQEMKCWGNEADGRTQVPALKNPKAISAGKSNTCAVDEDGVKCWGEYRQGQLNVAQWKSVKAMSAGNRTCVITEAGVECAGFMREKPPKLINP